MSQRKGRLGCVEFVKGAWEISELGLAQIRELAAIGSREKEIARYLQIGEKTFREWVDVDHKRHREDVIEAYEDGSSEFEQRLLRAQANLMETNAQMAIHLGKQRLGQKDDPVVHDHRHQIVGTLPDYNQTSDAWRKQFAPDTVQAMQIEAQPVEDAVVIHEPQAAVIVEPKKAAKPPKRKMKPRGKAWSKETRPVPPAHEKAQIKAKRSAE
jgi:hypothetical protein